MIVVKHVVKKNPFKGLVAAIQISPQSYWHQRLLFPRGVNYFNCRSPFPLTSFKCQHPHLLLKVIEITFKCQTFQVNFLGYQYYHQHQNNI